MRAALTIAGSDSSGGAGVQADLKTFAALGVYGASAITAITSQNTMGVSSVLALPVDAIRSQVECILDDLSIAAVKTGMLATGDVVLAVAEIVAGRGVRKLVVDPVFTATSGAHRTLLEPHGVSLMKTHLLPRALVVTPNIFEAAALAGIAVTSAETAREAARRIVDLGPSCVVVKGGHLDGEAAVDVLYDGRAFTEFTAPRSSAGPVHGAGCTFASAIAAGLALGDVVAHAVERAKGYVTGAIEHSVAIGRGARVLNHFWLY